MDQTAFKQLIDDYLAGRLDAATASQLELWLDTIGDEQRFELLGEEEKERSRIAGYNRLSRQIQRKERIASLANWKTFAGVAAAILLIVSLSPWLLDLFAPHRIISFYSKGATRKQILSDGSIVWLKGNSELLCPKTFPPGKREVTIIGEGLFEIAKDASRPFLVRSGALTTKVLGTSFNIKTTGDSVSITLLTGKIVISAPAGQPVTLSPAQQAIYTPQQSAIRQHPQDSSDVRSIIEQTEYGMAFNDARLNNILNRIERKFDVTIRLSDTAIAANRLTADLTDQSLDQSMNMICQALNLEFNANGKSILLKQKSEK
jgi:ferric-dicitrate binding protein FerR (iron transport regulator)